MKDKNFSISVIPDPVSGGFKSLVLKEEGGSWVVHKQCSGKTQEEAIKNAERELFAIFPGLAPCSTPGAETSITVAACVNDALPDEAVVSCGDGGVVSAMCKGCLKNCGGNPCPPVAFVAKTIITSCGDKSCWIRFLRFRGKNELDAYVAQRQNQPHNDILFVLLDETTAFVPGVPVQVAPSETSPDIQSMFPKFSDLPDHDVTFRTKDRFGNEITATFPGCKTVVDAAGDEVLHVKVCSDGTVQYLRTPHPDSVERSVGLAEFLRGKLNGIRIQNYEDVIRGGQIP